MPSIQVDGNDILDVHAAAGEAVEQARAGQAPALVERVTYRLGVSTTADDPKNGRKLPIMKKFKFKYNNKLH